MSEYTAEYQQYNGCRGCLLAGNELTSGSSIKSGLTQEQIQSYKQNRADYFCTGLNRPVMWREGVGCPHFQSDRLMDR